MGLIYNITASLYFLDTLKHIDMTDTILVPSLLYRPLQYISHLSDKIQKIVDQTVDGRVSDWFLITTWWHMFALTLLYLAAVYWGPKLMEKRNPVQMKWSLVFHNMALVILNAHIFYEFIVSTYKLNYSYSCQETHYGDNVTELRVAKALWWYYISKLFEFGDTIFFILRKKNSQITFLHVYHHASMFAIIWMGVRYYASGQAFFVPMINSLIHVFMYTYYGLAALGPSVQKYLWWKKYLTMMQITQFLFGVAHFMQALYFQCGLPLYAQIFCILYGISILSLFINFYIQAYIRVGYKRRGAKDIKIAHISLNGSNHATAIMELKKEE